MFTRAASGAISSKSMSEIETQLKMYREGFKYSEIADRTNSTPEAVQRHVRAWKLEIKAVEPDRTPEELQELRGRIRDLRSQELTMKAIGRQVGILAPQVYRHLQAMGLT